MTQKTQNSERVYAVRGGSPLQGEVRLSGAKNAALKELVAALLTDDEVVLHNMPDILDVRVTLEMLSALGAKTSFVNGSVTIDASGMKTSAVAQAFSRKNRIPILLMGPLLHRFQEAEIPALGGDAIGARPINFHLEALRKMGAEITSTDDRYIAKATQLKGTVIHLEYPSVGATENIMMAAVKAKGTTVIRNAAVEPEIVDLAMLLQSMGAIISLEVNRTWVIEGVSELHGATHRVIPDRLVAASFAAAAAITKGDVFVRDAHQVDLLTFLNALRRLGVPYEVQADGIRFMHADHLKPIVIETDVHPGFMTDWQQPLVTLLTQADGVSIVHETVYEERFGYTEALGKMGAKIQLHKECLGAKACRFINRDYRHSAIIIGSTPLKAADIVIPDIRAGFSYLIAALIADGESHLKGVDHIERGYEDMLGKLKGLGAEIEIV